MEASECERSGEIDGYSWAAGMAGRRLCTPKVDPARLSLSEWLTKCSKNKDSMKTPGQDAPNKPKNRGWSRVRASIGKSTFQVEAPHDRATTNRDTLGSQGSAGKNISPSESETATFRPVSQELRKRRHLHPRLRWPRFQRHVTEARPQKLPPLPSSSGAPNDCDVCASSHSVPASTGITRSGYDKFLDDEADGLDVQGYLRDTLTRMEKDEDIFIGPDSVFYIGDETTSWPPWGESSTSVGSLSLETTHSFLGGECINASTSNLSCSSSSSILPRSKPHEGPICGSTSTVHAISSRATEFGEASQFCAQTSPLSPLSPSPQARRGGRFGGFVIAKSSEGGYKRLGKKLDTLHSLHVEDEKWTARQAPVSLLMARHARGASRGTGKGTDQEITPRRNESNSFLDFASWGLDDAYLGSWLKSSAASDLSRIRQLNLAENRLTAKSIENLTKSGASLHLLRSFNLESNLLGERGCLEVANFLESAKPSLTEFMLSRNAMGDRSCEEICQSIRVWCHDMRVIGLAQNDLGLSDRAGMALGSLASELHELQVLDLHWNAFHGVGARCFFQGLYDNATTLTGKLSRLDLSWNRIGVQCANSQCVAGLESAPICSCSCCSATRRAVQMLASVFQDNKVLFHLDLSYNSISAANCSILADGLRGNHTLFGLHIMGNHATIDDLGFVAPTDDSTSFDTLSWCFENESTVNRCVRSVPPRIATKGTQNADLNPLSGKSPFQTSWGCIQRNVEKCWICENWYKQDIAYTPGLSGAEETSDEVTSVAAFFSIDGFEKATLLAKVEEAYNRHIFDRITPKVRKRIAEKQRVSVRKCISEKRENGCHVRSGLKDLIPRLPNGKVVRFVGSRVLPPCHEPVEVVFLVNGKTFVTAQDLPERVLLTPKLVQNRLSASMPGSPTQCTADEIREVNVLSVAMTALESFERGSACGLCILEDPAKRGDICVYPRRALNEKPQLQRVEWSFHSSWLKDFVRDTDEISAQCFDTDLNLSKTLQIIKDKVHQDNFISYLRPKYKQIVAGYHHAAFSYFDQSSPGVALNMFALRDTLFKYDQKVVTGGKNKGWLFDKKSLMMQDVDTSFVVANVYNPGTGDRPRLKALPEKGLCRFQFFEALVRIVCRRFAESGEKDDASLAMHEFLSVSKFGEEAMELRRSLHECLFTEEVDLVVKEFAYMLESLYDNYRFRSCNPGSHGKFSYGSWLELMRDADATAEGGLTQVGLGLAFALGKELRVDEAATLRHMELSRAEFVACLGAVVRLRDDFEQDFFGDMLADFLQGSISVPFNMLASGSMESIGSINFSSDPALAQVVALVSRLFIDADEDGSGSLTVREFRRCLGQAKIAEEIRQTGIEVSDFNVLFKQIDHDGSGEVTLDEFCEAFFKLKVAMRDVSKAVAYFRRVFSESDRDGSGTLDLHEFRSLCSDIAVQKKMQAFDISVDDIEAIFEDMVADCAERFADDKSTGEVTVDHMIAAFLRMRDPSLGGKRATNFMRQVFLEADTDRSGSLSREEYKQTFLSERVSQRITKLGLTIPDWLNIFDALDLDGDGELSQEELLQGVSTIWEAELQDSLRREVQKASKKAMTGLQRTVSSESFASPKMLKGSISGTLTGSLSNKSLSLDQSPVPRSLTAR